VIRESPLHLGFNKSKNLQTFCFCQIEVFAYWIPASAGMTISIIYLIGQRIDVIAGFPLMGE
jgi:hypothetical protein